MVEKKYDFFCMFDIRIAICWRFWRLAKSPVFCAGLTKSSYSIQILTHFLLRFNKIFDLLVEIPHDEIFVPFL